MTAIRAACDHLNIRTSDALQSRTERPQALGPPSLTDKAPTPGRLVDIKSFKQQKQPFSANEMAAVVAFYLSELAPNQERKASVEVGDMVRFFKQAGFPLPKHPRVLLANAKNAGYFDAAGDGRYRLNAVGYNLVAHNLPRGEGKGTPGSRPRKTKKRKTSARGKRQ